MGSGARNRVTRAHTPTGRGAQNKRVCSSTLRTSDSTKPRGAARDGHASAPVKEGQEDSGGSRSWGTGLRLPCEVWSLRWVVFLSLQLCAFGTDCLGSGAQGVKAKTSQWKSYKVHEDETETCALHWNPKRLIIKAVWFGSVQSVPFTDPLSFCVWHGLYFVCLKAHFLIFWRMCSLKKWTSYRIIII